MGRAPRLARDGVAIVLLLLGSAGLASTSASALTLAMTALSGALLLVALVDARTKLRAARESDARLRALADRLPDSMIYQLVRNADGTTRLAYVSAGIERLHGISAEVAFGDASILLGQIVEEDLPKVLEARAEALRSGSVANVAVRFRLPTGEIRWRQLSSRPHPLPGGGSLWDGVETDITEQRRAEVEARKSEHRMRLALESSRMGTWEWHVASDRMDWSDEVYAIGGLTRETYDGTLQALIDMFHPDDRDRVVSTIWRTLEGPIDEWTARYRLVRPDASVRWVEAMGRVYRDAQGLPTLAAGTVVDVTESLRDEERLRRANRALSTISHCNQVLVRATTEAELLNDICRVIVELGGYQLAWVGFAEQDEQRTVRIAGSAGHDDGYLDQVFVSWSDETANGQGTMGRAIRSGRPVVCRDFATDPMVAPWREIALRYGYRSGLALPLARGASVFGALAVFAAEKDAFDDSEISLLGELASDLAYGILALRTQADHRRAEESLASSEALLRQLIKHTPAAVAMFDADMRYLQASDRWLVDYHLEDQDLKGRSHYDVFPDIPERWREIHRRVLAGSVERCHEDPFPRADGGMEWLQWEVRPWLRADGAIGGLTMFTQVITARKRADEALRESEERFRQVVESIQEVFWMSDAGTGQLLYVSPGYEKIWGRPCETVYHSATAWRDTIHPDDRERFRRAEAAVQAAEPYHEEYRILRPDGSERWIQDRAFPIRDALGRIYRVAGVAEDITERRRIEERFHQSQKMEAIGQLAGGVAHDFNNLLSAMMMLAEEAAGLPGVPPRACGLMGDIMNTADRAAALTRQLLAFGRRQVMQPRRVDLNEVVTNLAKMLRRILGEDLSLELELTLDGSPLFTHADAGMLEQVLLNLAVNARDAMPGGGRLVVSTGSRVLTAEEARSIPEGSAGRYVALEVQDAGCGIPQANLHRIFEPFFTTKELGKGTGLGLATVFGIVKQHRGLVLVESELGRGTTFRVLLPADDSPDDSAAEPAASEAPASERRGGGETILVVEDDTDVRRVIQAVLSRNGYQVLDAANGPEALVRWERYPDRIHLLLTDMVMPEGLGGIELARLLVERDPELKVIFTSGYSAELAGRALRLDHRQNFLEKPCRPDRMLSTLRRALDGA